MVFSWSWLETENYQDIQLYGWTVIFNISVKASNKIPKKNEGYFSRTIRKNKYKKEYRLLGCLLTHNEVCVWFYVLNSIHVLVHFTASSFRIKVMIFFFLAFLRLIPYLAEALSSRHMTSRYSIRCLLFLRKLSCLH